jgi:transcriptional regulator with XRE-family HTH domain
MHSNSTANIGNIIRGFRQQRHQTLVDLAKALNIDRAYLNKIELGQVKPSAKLLDKILVHFSVEDNLATKIKQAAGHVPLVVSEAGKEKAMGDQAQVAVPQQEAMLNINPMQTPVLFTDSTFVSSSDYGLVLDVAQMVGGQQHNVVARIGMSFEHAKKLIEVMQDNIAKYER